MSKKSRKSRGNSNTNKDNVVHSMFDDPYASKGKSSGWHPLDDEINAKRDKKFIKTIKPRSKGQEILMKAIQDHSLTLAIGPAGTGKTYLAITAAVEALEKGEVERIILSRPAMEAGESLGYLPGDMHEKMAPYLRPLYDALGDRMGGKKVRQYIEEGVIEIAPVGFMRGRTLNNAYVVIDEAQNCTYVQLKMLLSRLGWHSTMIVTGDPEQTDLLPELSGLDKISKRLDALKNVAVVKLDQKDIVRHPLVAEMLDVL
ncbi:MAG: phosphate starvation-inducible protein PhoH [Micavibrio sp.]|nr:phosphate starvation-inducible protein PhoH [Micavibrio sp.]|tara:strand:- start:4205 stop:4978 length:774 start_codon:yes stop_codon:yes gene_type:complete